MLPAGLPEVNFHQVGPVREEAVPLVVSHTDIRAHESSLPGVRELAEA